MNILSNKKNTDTYSYLVGNSTSTKSTEKQLSNAGTAELSFQKCLSKFTDSEPAIKSYVNYSAKTFDETTSKSYQEYMTQGVSVSKFYVTAVYQKLLKDAEEFEKLIRKLVAEAQRNNKSAMDALKMINTYFKEAQDPSKSKEEIFSNLLAKVNDFLNGFNPNTATKEQKEIHDILTLSLKAVATENNTNLKIDNVINQTFKYKKFDDDKTEDAYLLEMYSKLKQKRKYQFSTTEDYLNHKKIQDEFDVKIDKITNSRFNQDKVSEQEEIKELMTDSSNHSLLILDENKSNRFLQSPLFDS
ncbi:MAG: hypothetical protein U0457_08365 [Candidatus Sericytochromatia bacterium]